ncbi:translation initiation factor IF-2 [Candidatus Zixiibacteriota bacterium]
MTKQNRVYDVARDFKVSSQAMIEVLQSLNFEIKSHMSPVNEAMMLAIEEYFEGQKAESKAEVARKKEIAEKRKELEEAEKEAVKAERVAAKKKVEGEPRVEGRPERKKPEGDASTRVAEKLARAKAETERLQRLASKTKQEAEARAAAPDEEVEVEAVETEVAEAEEAVPEEAVAAESVEAVETDLSAGEETGIVQEEAASEESEEEQGKEIAETAEEGTDVTDVEDSSEEGKAGRLSGSSLRERIRQTKEAREAEGEGPKIIERRAPQPKERRPAPQTTAAAAATPQKKKKRKKGRKAVDQEEVRSTIKETLAGIRSGPGRSKGKRRRQEREGEEGEVMKVEERRVIQITEFASVSELAAQMEVGASDIIAACFQLGFVVTINQRLDMETIEFIADEFDFEVESIHEFGADIFDVDEEETEDTVRVSRAPVVTVMGHVDHGKTSLLDYIRQSTVVAGEVGGITQHIGAYEVETAHGNITFLDTPGHEAFTAMRARGASLTDIVVLVVAADDKVMPQTVEAINHAKAAGVPIVVAINKIDLPDADPDGVKQQLTQHSIVVEDFGGETVALPVSAKTGEGVDKLLELLLIQAEMLELTADRTGFARGVVLEAELDKGRGPVATVLVQKGELKEGDPFLAGLHSGSARALFDQRGRPRKDVHPSQAVQILGFDGLPQPGDSFHTLADEKEARILSQKRQQIRRQQEFAVREATSLSELRARIEVGEISELPLIVKADTDGSMEALSDSFHKLSTDEVKVKVIHQGVGGINESDVMLAQTSGAIIVGFHVRPDKNARDVAEQVSVEIRLYDIIYEAVEEIKLGLEGLLKPDIKEEVTSSIEVREVFRVPKIGTIAGSMVIEGTITRNSKVRLIRDGIVVYDGRVGSLKRFKEDVKEVKQGFECGIGIENFNDIKVGDVIEVYEIEEIARTLEG